METTISVFILHLLATLLMTGVIWVVQLVHYPAFLFVDKGQFSKFEQFHSVQISKVVMPLMLIELFTAVILLFSFPFKKILLVSNLGLLIATWSVTAFFSMRYHKLLLSGFNKEYILNLVKTNIFRTVFWSTRSAILIYLLAGMINTK